MEQQVDLAASPREERGKNAARRLRANGKVPAVLYGLGKDSIALTVDTPAIVRIVQSPAGHNQIVNLQVADGEQVAVLATDWQVDPVRGKLLHVDMRRVDLTKPVHATVPLDTVGVARGVKEHGGVEEIVHREVHVNALPADVPLKIEVDVTELEIGQAIRLRDVPTSEKYEFTGNPDEVLVHVVAPRVEEVAEVAAPEEGAEGVEPAAEKAEGEAQPDKAESPEKS